MNNFTIDFVSENRREHLVIEIHFKNQRLCQINKEKGNENLEIEFITDLYKLPEIVEMSFPLSDFLAILEEAKTSLTACP
jgi:hypothetical protein